jgi:outer membrane protein, heavy metal efflux system
MLPCWLVPRLSMAWRSWFALSLVGAGILAWAPSVRAEDVPRVQLPRQLVLAEALRLFRQQGLDLLLAEAAADSARGDEQVAGAIINPALSGTIGKTFNYDATSCVDGAGRPVGGCSSVSWSLGLSDQAAIGDVLSGKRGLRLSVARSALAAARLGRADAERTISFQIKQQYLQVAMFQRLVDFAKEVRRAATQTFELNRVRLRTGAISEAELLKAEVAKLEAEQAVDQARQSRRAARVALAFLLGVRGPLPAFRVDADVLRFRVPDALARASLPALHAQALAQRPDLRAAGLQRDRAEASIRLARRMIITDVALSLSYSQEGTAPSAIQPPTLTAGLGLTLPIFYQRQGEVTKAKADLRQQVLQRAKVEAQVAADIAGALAAFLSTRRLVERMEKRLLEAARRTRELVAVQYRKGAASLLEYLDATRTYIANNVEYQQDLAAYWTAVFQLELAVGKDLR